MKNIKKMKNIKCTIGLHNYDYNFKNYNSIYDEAIIKCKHCSKEKTVDIEKYYNQNIEYIEDLFMILSNKYIDNKTEKIIYDSLLSLFIKDLKVNYHKDVYKLYKEYLIDQIDTFKLKQKVSINLNILFITLKNKI